MSDHRAYRLGGRISMLRLMAILAVIGVVATISLHLLWG